MRNDFTLDPNIIHHIIHSQAGSIGKALIELVMNSMDAKATEIRLTVTPTGFSCVDDGQGFSSKQEVLEYFGRFGTPHEEGDATFGRFRLGRGQIMAYAPTVWRSHSWQMAVDTKTMGYAYDLEDLLHPVLGCEITGSWYDPLPQTEYLGLLQEIRDLVRYTPVPVLLNDVRINRIPHEESWDYEDGFAWYRVREEGSVSIFNQGILVRHDASHLWGAGGVLVSKQALGLNVSRTEILRKTDPVWKHIEGVFRRMAGSLVRTERRNTEAWRTHCAHLLVSGATENLHALFREAPVITVLPGKRHITILDFLFRCQVQGKRDRFTMVRSPSDIPIAENIAFAKAALVLHPVNYDRFRVSSGLDFIESIQKILTNIMDLPAEENTSLFWDQKRLSREKHELQVVDFDLLKKHFQEKVAIIPEKSLGKEVLRVWRAAKAALEGYACLCAGGAVYSTLVPVQRKDNLQFMFRLYCGDSEQNEAWTDGESYIAINKKIITSLLSHPLKTMQKLFTVVEHEVSHQGDSVGAGHDLEFYERFHEIAQRCATYRHGYLQFFLRRYSLSLVRAASKQSKMAGEVKNHLVQTERVQRDLHVLGLDTSDLSGAGEELALNGSDDASEEQIQEFIDFENKRLRELLIEQTGVDPDAQEEIDWEALQKLMQERQREHWESAIQWEQEAEVYNSSDDEFEAEIDLNKALEDPNGEVLRFWLAEAIGLRDTDLEEITEEMVSWVRNKLLGCSVDEALDIVRTAWHNEDSPETYRPWLSD